MPDERYIRNRMLDTTDREHTRVPMSDEQIDAHFARQRITSQSLAEFNTRYAYGEIGALTPSLDLWAIGQLVNASQAKRFLEVGTYIGYTARYLARNYPQLQITTVDPGDQIEPMQRSSLQGSEYLAQDDIGHLARGMLNVAIVKAPFLFWAGGYKRHAFDMAFIDGDHRTDAVIADTTAALGLLRSPGLILWHDAGRQLKSVDRALVEISQRFGHQMPNGIVTIEGTWLAYARVTG
jgi:predicted O-methyltransferase YrrM